MFYYTLAFQNESILKSKPKGTMFATASWLGTFGDSSTVGLMETNFGDNSGYMHGLVKRPTLK